MNQLSLLPQETLLSIFIHLEPSDLQALTLTSKSIHILAEDNSVWQNHAIKLPLFFPTYKIQVLHNFKKFIKTISEVYKRYTQESVPEFSKATISEAKKLFLNFLNEKKFTEKYQQPLTQECYDRFIRASTDNKLEETLYFIETGATPPEDTLNHALSHRGTLKTIEFLLNKSGPKEDSLTAAYNGKASEPVIDLLLARGARTLNNHIKGALTNKTLEVALMVSPSFETLHKLLKAGALISEDILTFACYGNASYELIIELIKLGARPTEGAFLAAVSHPDLRVLEKFFEFNTLKFPTLLNDAIYRNAKPSVLIYLLKQGVEPLNPPHYDPTLDRALHHHAPLSVIKALIKGGAKLSENSLEKALLEDLPLNFIEALVEQGASVTFKHLTQTYCEKIKSYLQKHQTC